MPGIAIKEYKHWQEAKKEGWNLDATSLKHVLDGCQRELNELRWIGEQSKTQEAAVAWEEAFGEDERLLSVAVQEIQEALEKLSVRG